MAVKTGTGGIHRLLNDEGVRSIELNGKRRYCAADLVPALTGESDGGPGWDEIKIDEPSLRSRCVQTDLGGEPRDVLDLSGVMLLIGTLDTPRAERLRGWIAKVAVRHLEEQADPELAIQRLRQSYAAQGRTRQWIDQRLRSISARQDIVGEWHRRGVKESEQFRILTNRLTEATFGLNVNSFRESKGYSQDLRDHLSDLELALLSLSETTAASLHRHRNSSGIDELTRDIDEAGQIVNQTRRRIAQATIAGSSEAA